MPETFIIAEAGLAHNGLFEKAMELAIAARDTGANAIKYQTWFHDRWPDLEGFKFRKHDWYRLFDFCNSIGIKWMSTPFDFEAIEFLDVLGMDVWKIPSGMITNKEYLEKVASIQPDRIILSTGMATYAEEGKALDIIAPHVINIDVLYCVTAYPAPYDEIILDLLQDYDGISDHSTGIEIPIASVALGAKIVEKHMHLAGCAGCPDHACSLTPDQFNEMVCAIRNVEKALNATGTEKPTKSELKVRDTIRERMGCFEQNENATQ